MGSFNKVIIMGNLTRDVDLKYLQSGIAVGDVGLAINDVYKDKDGNKVEDVTFVDVTFWGRQAEIAAEYAKKGSQILIEGRLKLDSWEAEDGSKRSKLKVVAERLQLTGSKGGGPSPSPSPSPPVSGGQPVNNDEDVPF